MYGVDVIGAVPTTDVLLSVAGTIALIGGEKELLAFGCVETSASPEAVDTISRLELPVKDPRFSVEVVVIP